MRAVWGCLGKLLCCMRGGSHVFALKFKPPKQQAFVVELTSLNDLKSERVVFDPNELNTNGTTAIDWYVAVA